MDKRLLMEENYINPVGMDKEIVELIKGSYGILLNANDFFQYATSMSVTLDYWDLHWAIPIITEYGTVGENAVMSYIAKTEPIGPYRTEKFKEAIQKLTELNPVVHSEW